MINKILLFLCCGALQFAAAQQIAQLNTSGGFLSNTQMGQLETSIGAIFSTLELKQGESINAYFLQPLSNTIAVKDEIDENNILITPNPATDLLTIKSPFDIAEVLIFDINGKTIKTINQKTTTIDISFLNSGLYIIQIKYNTNITALQKFIKI